MTHTAAIAQLAAAIDLVVAFYRDECKPNATVREAIESTRSEVDLTDIDILASSEAWMSAELADANRLVLTALDEQVEAALTRYEIEDRHIQKFPHLGDWTAERLRQYRDSLAGSRRARLPEFRRAVRAATTELELRRRRKLVTA